MSVHFGVSIRHYVGEGVEGEILHICKWKANGEFIYVYNIYPLLSTFFFEYFSFWNWNKNNYEWDQNHKHVHDEIEYQDEQCSAVNF